MILKAEEYKKLLDKFISKEANEDEVKRLADWMKNTETPEEFDSYCKQLWESASTHSDKQMEQEMWNIIAEKITKHNKVSRLIPALYRIAACILLPICLLMGTYIYFQKEAEKTRDQDKFEVLVDKGQKANVVLPDGTKVWVNSGSKLSYNYSKNKRSVALDGEAYFEVAKDAEKRFVVNCNDLNVEALGTTFNVKGYSADEIVTVALFEGKVKVFNETNNTVLEPNQLIAFNRIGNTFSHSEIADSREIDFWRRNILFFRSVSLADIAKTLERTYGVTVRFKDEDLKKVPFSGSIRNSSLNNVFHIISLTYPISYEINNDVITIYKDQYK